MQSSHPMDMLAYSEISNGRRHERSGDFGRALRHYKRAMTDAVSERCYQEAAQLHRELRHKIKVLRVGG